SDEGRLTSLRDLEALIKPLSGRENLWLVGSSFGANLAVNYAAEHREVTGLVLLTPGFNYGGLTAREALTRLQQPVLIAASEDDPGAVETALELYDLVSAPKKFLKLEENGHGA